MDYGIRFLETAGASYQDVSFNFKVWALAKRVYMIDDYLLYYRSDNENSSVKSKDKVYAIHYEWQEVESFLNKHIELRNILWDMKNSIKLAGYIWNCNRLSDEKAIEFSEFMKVEFKKEYNNGSLKIDKIADNLKEMLKNLIG
jgi:hypothetical protein